MFSERRGFRVCMGARYLGGYIGDKKSKQDWFRDRTLTWEKNINTIRKKHGEISPGELRRSGTYDPIRMDISSTRHPGHRRLVCRSGEDDLRKRFASPFLWKEENPLPRCGRSTYDAGQEIRTGTPESSEVRSGEVLKIHTRERRNDTGRDWRG